MPENVSVVWGPKYNLNSSRTIYPELNGYKNSIVINVYRMEDGKEKICNFLVNEVIRKTGEAENLSIDWIDEQLNRYYGSIPDPDLALYFGHVQSTYGFLPWQIRLTEFLKIDNSYKKDLKLRKFLDVLFKFATVQQRFGKWLKTVYFKLILEHLSIYLNYSFYSSVIQNHFFLQFSLK